MSRSLRETLTYWATRIGMRAAIITAALLPRPAIYAVADGAALFGYFCFRSFRSRSLKNLKLAFGERLTEPEIRRTARDSLQNFFRAFVELAIVLSFKEEEIRSFVPIVGCAHLDAALAKGKGVILVSAHLGNFFLLGTRLALGGYPMHVLINQPREGKVARLMDAYRLQIQQKTIHARPRRDALQQLTHVLRENEVAIVIADEYRNSGSGVRVPFFGRPVLARRGPVTLALRTGAAIVPACVIRQQQDKLVLVIEPEIELIRSKRGQPQIVENTIRLTDWVEKTVRAYRDQWNWMTVRWEDSSRHRVLADEHRLERITP